MDVGTITSLISTVGFPIVCCAALFWQQNKSMADLTAKIESAISKLSDNTQANTESIIQLVTTVKLLSDKDGDN